MLNYLLHPQGKFDFNNIFIISLAQLIIKKLLKITFQIFFQSATSLEYLKLSYPCMEFSTADEINFKLSTLRTLHLSYPRGKYSQKRQTNGQNDDTIDAHWLDESSLGIQDIYLEQEKITFFSKSYHMDMCYSTVASLLKS